MAISKNVLFTLPLLFSIAQAAPAPRAQAPPVAASYANYNDFLAAWQVWGLAYVGQAPAGVAASPNAASLATSIMNTPSSSVAATPSNPYSIVPIISSSVPTPSANLSSTQSAYLPAQFSSSMLTVQSYTATPSLTVIINQSSAQSSPSYTPASTSTPASTNTPTSTYIPTSTTTKSSLQPFMTNIGNLFANFAMQIARPPKASATSVASPSTSNAAVVTVSVTSTAVATAIVKPSATAKATPTPAAHGSNSCNDQRYEGAGCSSYNAPVLGIGAGFS